MGSPQIRIAIGLANELAATITASVRAIDADGPAEPSEIPIAQSVHGHVQADAEEVLVMGSEGLRRDQRAEVGGLTWRESTGQDDAGQLRLELDSAVLIEVPVDRVLVVARGDDKRDNQPAAATSLGRIQHRVKVLPKQAEILLVQADGLADRVRLTVAVGEFDVKGADFLEAVAALLE
jgi:hypothetical protein